MKLIEACLCAGICLAAFAANADEKLPFLKSGDDVYSNVTVTSVTATDIYFTHSGGIGNTKLKNLTPELQKHFHFDPAKAGAAQQAQAEATAQFQRNILAEKAEAASSFPPPKYENGDLVFPKIFARSFRGEHPPPVNVDHWLTSPPPSLNGKFVLVVFWESSAEECRRAIPHINDLALKFKDRLIVIGVSNESEDEIRKTPLPTIHFCVGTDTESRSFRAYELTAVPHAVLIDPTGIVRFEGPPTYLTEKDLAHLLDTYAQ